ncbi:hypothetical protein [Sphingobium boeckii]|uniref:Uncharacterized protein n=1 Tax=Sphingobium boeckii TaxID=1082345 RepID=A0A7W9AHU2_9SPHN|nr:hypothetical protein [Sphingobium boeckii]MBB5685957.1 hypothetical protein [Sphingobium boeckii]
METPIYPPAAAYEAPVVRPYVLSADGCSVAELMANPAAWAVMLKYMPSIGFITQIPETKKLLDNMTVVDFAVFGPPVDPKTLATINAELAQIPSTGAAR